jgi:hypothetical protein
MRGLERGEGAGWWLRLEGCGRCEIELGSVGLGLQEGGSVRCARWVGLDIGLRKDRRGRRGARRLKLEPGRW